MKEKIIMKHHRILAMILLMICLTACGTYENNSNSCPIDDFSNDRVRFTTVGYVPYVLEATEDTVTELSETLCSSTWEIIDKDTPIPDGENFSVFVYNSGHPYRLIFYADYSVDYNQDDNITRYKIGEDAYTTAFNAAHGKDIDHLSEHLIWCEFEDISAEGVWKTDTVNDTEPQV